MGKLVAVFNDRISAEALICSTDDQGLADRVERWIRAEHVIKEAGLLVRQSQDRRRGLKIVGGDPCNSDETETADEQPPSLWLRLLE